MSKTFSKVFSIILINGEKAKSIQNFQKILNFLAENDFDRTDAIIAVGGGVIGDIAGYVASSYLRGVNLFKYQPLFLRKLIHLWVVKLQ